MSHLILDRSHKLGGLTGNCDETCPTLGLFTVETMKKLVVIRRGKPECIIIKWNAIHNVQVQPTVAQAIRLFPLAPPHQGSF